MRRGVSLGSRRSGLPDTIWVLSETSFIAAAKSFVAVLCLICLTGVSASSIRFENLASTWAQLRQEVPDLFELGEYLPLKLSGDGRESRDVLCESHGDRWLIVLAPRLTSRALGRRVDPDTGIKPALRLPAGCPSSSTRATARSCCSASAACAV